MQILDLELTWLESEPRIPFVCLLSIGSDPTTQIGALAKQKEIGKYMEMTKTIMAMNIIYFYYALAIISAQSRFNGTRSGVSCTQNDSRLHVRWRLGFAAERALILALLC